jgi:hypothetical protein
MWNFNRRLKEFDDYKYSIKGKNVAILSVLRSRSSYDFTSLRTFISSQRKPLNDKKTYLLKILSIEHNIWITKGFIDDYEVAKLSALVALKEEGYEVSFKKDK